MVLSDIFPSLTAQGEILVTFYVFYRSAHSPAERQRNYKSNKIYQTNVCKMLDLWKYVW